jgi:hypothetical protein
MKIIIKITKTGIPIMDLNKLKTFHEKFLLGVLF